MNIALTITFFINFALDTSTPKSWQVCLYILTKGVIEILSSNPKLGRLEIARR